MRLMTGAKLHLRLAALRSADEMFGATEDAWHIVTDTRMTWDQQTCRAEISVDYLSSTCCKVTSTSSAVDDTNLNEEVRAFHVHRHARIEVLYSGALNVLHGKQEQQH